MSHETHRDTAETLTPDVVRAACRHALELRTFYADLAQFIWQTVGRAELLLSARRPDAPLSADDAERLQELFDIVAGWPHEAGARCANGPAEVSAHSQTTAGGAHSPAIQAEGVHEQRARRCGAECIAVHHRGGGFDAGSSPTANRARS